MSQIPSKALQISCIFISDPSLFWSGTSPFCSFDKRLMVAGVKNGKENYPKKGQVGVLHLSPPCQSLSQANRHTDLAIVNEVLLEEGALISQVSPCQASSLVSPLETKTIQQQLQKTSTQEESSLSIPATSEVALP